MRFRTLVALVAVLGTGLLIGTAAAMAEERLQDGVRHVHVGEPLDGVEDLRLEEVWRVGGEDEEGLLIGIVIKALVDERNNVYLLDGQLSRVYVLSADGRLQDTLGGPGSGPGEVTEPGDMVFMPDGTLGLVQVFPGKIVKLNLDGTPGGEVIPGSGAAGSGFLALVNGRAHGEDLVLSGISISGIGTGQRRTHFVRRFSPDGTLINEYFNKVVEWDFSRGITYSEAENDFVWWRMDVGPSGRLVVCEERYGYALSVYSLDGTLECVIHRDYDSWVRDGLTRKRHESMMRAQLNQFPSGTRVEVEGKEQDISDLLVDDGGNIWVLTSREMFEPETGTFAKYDVFDPQGAYRKQVRVFTEGDASRDRLLFTGDGLVFKIIGFWDAVLVANGGTVEVDDHEPRPMEVVCCQIRND